MRDKLLRLAQEKMIGENHAWWCFASLSTYHVDFQQVYLTGNPDITLALADELTTLFNRHFKDEHIQFFRLNAFTWLIKLDKKPDVVVENYDAVLGKPIFAHLPKGPDKKRVHGWFNESQMILNPFFQNKGHQSNQEGFTLWFWEFNLKPKWYYRIIHFFKKNKNKHDAVAQTKN